MPNPGKVGWARRLAYHAKIVSKFRKYHSRIKAVAPYLPDTRNLTPETYKM
ncbi:hypothetical protein D1AOALGA4SA_6360 [Olavius algarvensis Delta 1 endosymbiont]|nr:hypothetical protein D1AOALGA4SA_6360 [Olavius algarvensis Delta 1 endosymbiont]